MLFGDVALHTDPSIGISGISQTEFAAKIASKPGGAFADHFIEIL